MGGAHVVKAGAVVQEVMIVTEGATHRYAGLTMGIGFEPWFSPLRRRAPLRGEWLV